MPTQWLDPDAIINLLHQTQPDWAEQGATTLGALVDAWEGKEPVDTPEVKQSPFVKRFLSKATRVGPSITGPIQDAQGHKVCFQDGEHVPCEQFGGRGEGWSELRAEEDLYDALRRLVDELKAGKHEGWHEIVGLLVHTPVEKLQALKNEHRLSAPPDVKQSILQRIQDELQHVRHQIEGEQPGVKKIKTADLFRCGGSKSSKSRRDSRIINRKIW